MIRLVGNILLVVSAVEAVAFVVLYWRWADWWQSETGRHLMAFEGALALVLTLTVVRVLAGDSGPFRLARLVVFALVPVLFGQRLWLLHKAQRRRKGNG